MASSYQFGSPDPLGTASDNLPTQTAAEAAQANGYGVRVNTGGAHRVTFSDGNVTTETLGVVTYDPSKIPNGERGLMSTLNRGGRPIVAADARPTDFVNIGGMDVRLDVAERMGFFERTESGRIANVSNERMREVTGAAEAERQQSDNQAELTAHAQQQDANKLTNADAEASLGAIMSASPTTITSVLTQAAEKGTVDSGLLGTLSSEAGVDPSVMGAHLSKAMSGLTDQAKAFAGQRGIPAALFEQFGSWAQENHPAEAREAIVNHVQKRDPSVYGKLLDRFTAGLADIAPEAALQATLADGSKPYRGPAGNVMVRVGNTQMEWRAAFRSGLVKLNR